jgi:glycosyltransferase involved in cell wall biosynthesis
LIDTWHRCKSFIKSSKRWTYIKRFLALRSLIRSRHPDILISFLPNVNIAAILASTNLKLTTICCERSDPSNRSVSKFWTLISRLIYRYANVIIVQTDRTARKVKELYPRLRSVIVIPNPLPDAIVSIYRQQENKSRKVLLSVGRLSQEKQLSKSIAVFSALAEEFPDWDFHIYGDGPLNDALSVQIKSLYLDNRIFLKGLVSNPWAVMAAADVFVMTSKFEGFPNALLEAMGVGLPCVVFDCPSGPREVTFDGRDALLVPLDDQIVLETALRKVMDSEVLRAQLGAQARKSVIERYSLQVVLAKWDSLFNLFGVNA